MVRSNGRFLKAVKAVSAAAVALVLGGALLGCPPPIDDEGYYRGGDIVGDWLPYSSSSSYDGVPDGDIEYYNDPDRKRLMSFRPSGEAAQWGFEKVGTVWVEIPFDNREVVMWRVENQTIYVRIHRETGDREENIGTYTISGDRLTLTDCHYHDDEEDGNAGHVQHCEVETFTKVDVNNIRAGLPFLHLGCL